MDRERRNVFFVVIIICVLCPSRTNIYEKLLKARFIENFVASVKFHEIMTKVLSIVNIYVVMFLD